jgi:hypothetical protein
MKEIEAIRSAMSAVLAHIEAQAAELAAADIAVAEYRQQGLDNHKELIRLRSDVTRPESLDVGLMRAEIQRLRALLGCVEVNLSIGISKSIQRLQARTIREELNF